MAQVKLWKQGTPLTLLAIVDDYESFVFTRHLTGVGTWSLTLDGNSPNQKLIRDADFISAGKGKAGLVKKIEGGTVEGEKLVLSGVELKGLAYNRIVIPAENYAYLSFNNKAAEYIIAELLNTQLINPADSKRKITNSKLNTYTQEVTGLTKSYRYKNVGEMIEELATTYNIGWYADIQNGNIEFNIFHGLDRKNTQNINEPLIISYERDAIEHSSFAANKGTPKTALVAGQGDGAYRSTVIVGDSDSDIVRNEIYVDARDIEDEVDLPARGYQKLAEHSGTHTYHVRLNQHLAAKYGDSFDLGDEGTVQDGILNQQVHLLLTEITEAFELEGYVVDVVFGYDLRTLRKYFVGMRQETENLQVRDYVEISDVEEAVGDLENTITTTFKDGVISEAEAKAIEKYKNLLESEKGDLDTRYTAVYNDTNLIGTPKTNLNSKKTAYNTAHSNLMAAINTAIADGTTTVAEKQNVDSKFATYKTALSELASAFEAAAAYISTKKANDATAAANQFTTEQIDAVNGEIGEVETSVGKLRNFTDTSFADGLITRNEAAAIEKYINVLNSEKKDVDNKYTSIYGNSDLTGTPKTALATAKSNYNTAHTNLITSINNAISDGKTTTTEKNTVDSNYTTYNTRLSELRTHFENAINAIAKAKADKALADAKAFTTSEISSVNTEISDVKGSVNGLKNFTDTAFSDGIVSRNEAASIQKYINTLNAEKEDVDKQYTNIYGNTDLSGTPKTALSTAKSNYNTAHTNLISSINTAISDGKATTAEQTDVNNKFTTYSTRLGELRTAFENAINAIGAKKAADATAAANSYTDGKVSTLNTAIGNKNSIYRGTYAQMIAKTGMKVGDIWIATNENNREYQAISTAAGAGSWVLISVGKFTGATVDIDAESGLVNIAAGKKVTVASGGILELAGQNLLTIGSGGNLNMVGSNINMSAGGKINLSAADGLTFTSGGNLGGYVDGKIGSIQVGGQNLLRESDTWADSDWLKVATPPGAIYILSTASQYGHPAGSIAVDASQSDTLVYIQQNVPCVKGRQYTFSAEYLNFGSGAYATVTEEKDEGGYWNVHTLNSSVKKVTMTTTSSAKRLIVQFVAPAHSYVFAYHPILVEGNANVLWAKSPNDLQASITQVSQKITPTGIYNLVKQNTEYVNAMGAKAEASTVTALNTTVGQIEGAITTIQGGVTNKSMLQMADDRVGFRVDKIVTGGANLLRGTDKWDWAFWNRAVPSPSTYGVLQVEQYGQPVGSLVIASNMSGGVLAYVHQIITPKPNQEYTLSVEHITAGGGSRVALVEQTSGGAYHTQNLDNNKKSVTITTKADTYRLHIQIIANAGGYIYCKHLMLTEGNLPQAWAPHPEDPASGVKTSYIEIASDKIELKTDGNLLLNSGAKFAVNAGTIQLDAADASDSHLQFGDAFSVSKGATGYQLAINSKDDNAIQINNNSVWHRGNLIVQQAQPPSGKRTVWLKPNQTASVSYSHNFTATAGFVYTPTNSTKSYSLTAVSGDTMSASGTYNVSVTVKFKRYGGTGMYNTTGGNIRLTKGGQSINMSLPSLSLYSWEEKTVTVTGSTTSTAFTTNTGPITCEITVSGTKAYDDSDFLSHARPSEMLCVISGTGSGSGVQPCEIYYVP